MTQSDLQKKFIDTVLQQPLITNGEMATVFKTDDSNVRYHRVALKLPTSKELLRIAEFGSNVEAAYKVVKEILCKNK